MEPFQNLLLINEENIPFPFSQIFVKAGILTTLIYIYHDSKTVASKLKVSSDAISDELFEQFSIRVDDLIGFIHDYEQFQYLIPSIGMQAAYDVIVLHKTLDDDYLELLDEQNSSKFEFKFIKNRSSQHSYLHKFRSYVKFGFVKNYDLTKSELYTKIIELKEREEYFIHFVEEYENRFPPCFDEIPFKEQVEANRNLSIVFLCGQSYLETPGISSFHLRGSLTPSVRRFNTGFISFMNSNGRDFPEQFPVWFQFLRENNPLYENVETIKEDTMSKFVLSLTDKIGASSAFLIPQQDEMSEKPIVSFSKTNKDFLVYVSKKEDGEAIKLPFEVAIASLFPLLFPYGPLIRIPGDTIRKKVQNLLFSHERFRCGPVAAQLILFCFDLIIQNDNFFFQKNIKPRQIVKMPENTDRSINPALLMRKDDPAFPLYWRNQLLAVNAYCEQFGNPDLMVTLTFGNRWDECVEFVSMMKDKYQCFNDPQFGMPDCGVETMFIFKERLSSISSRSFNSFIKLCNLPDVVHRVCRLEFQARGAPHVHILLWLKERIKLEEVKVHFFGSLPSCKESFLNHIITTQMKHKCKKRCFTGSDTSKCKYGFPKPVCEETHINDENRIVYARSEDDVDFVEHCSALLLEWGAHAHVHILRLHELEDSSHDSINYVLKYNMKSEPNITIMVSNADLNWKHVFNGRIVSLEEAVARIYSFSFCEKDVMTKFIDISIPSKRKATFDALSRQKTFDDVEAYFLRPSSLWTLSILDFYSQYDIHYISYDEWLSLDLDIISRKGSVEGIYYKVKKRSKPCIITFRSFDILTQTDAFAYHYMILSQTRIEDIELGEGQTYSEYLAEHLNPEVVINDVSPTLRSFVNYLIKYERFSIEEVVHKMIRLIKNGIAPSVIISVLNSLRNNPYIQRPEFGISFISSDDELLEEEYVDETETVPDMLYPDSVFPNLRIKNITEQINNYIEAIKIEETNDFSVNQERAKKYLFINFDSDERANAKYEFDTLYQMLNTGQRDVVDSIIDGFPSREPFFISGKAGTGKSFVINTLKKYFIANNIPFLITASTGIASVLIGGKTLHSAFSIFSKEGHVYSGIVPNHENGKSLGLLEVLFVDEVTMVHKDIFNLIDMKLRELRAHVKGDKRLLEAPFGGVMLLLTGDLCQVPCVEKNASDAEQFMAMFNNMKMFPQFHLHSLYVLMRQQISIYDPFAKLLEEVRNFTDDTPLSCEVINHIRTKFIELIPCEYYKIYDIIGDEGLAIFYKNKSCDTYNEFILKYTSQIAEQRLYCRKGILMSSYLNSYMSGTDLNVFEKEPATQRDINYYISLLKKRESSSLVPFAFTFSIGSRVMLLKNLDTSAGLVNGRRGTVVEVHLEDEMTPIGIDVLFDEISDFPSEMHTITMTKVDQFVKANGKKFDFYQFPLKLCYAVTAHKAQGQTLNKVAVCIDEKAFAHGAFYVAISRVKNWDDLIFFGSKWPENGPELHSNEFINEFNARIQNEM